MAMNLGFKTRKLIIGTTNAVRISNTAYSNIFKADGTYDLRFEVADSNGDLNKLQEDQYIDLGIVTNESEDLNAGGIAMSIVTQDAASRINWAVGGRVLRVIISGIIPDGTYVADSSDAHYTQYNGMSNVSVFRYKINTFLAYASLWGKGETSVAPNTVQYRRAYVNEKMLRSYSGSGEWADEYETGISPGSEIGSYVCTNYSFNMIDGTRHGKYTLSLDFANEANTKFSPADRDKGIFMKQEGDI